MLDGRVLEASQVEYKPFGKTALKREPELSFLAFSLSRSAAAAQRDDFLGALPMRAGMAFGKARRAEEDVASLAAALMAQRPSARARKDALESLDNRVTAELASKLDSSALRRRLRP